MFIIINGESYNLNYIGTFEKLNKEVSDTIEYCIIYETISGLKLIEKFNNEIERDKKYNSISK